MKMNDHLNIVLDNDLKNALKKRADEIGVSDAHYCREAIRKSLKVDSQSDTNPALASNIETQLKRIESLLRKKKRGADFGKRSSKIRDS